MLVIENKPIRGSDHLKPIRSINDHGTQEWRIRDCSRPIGYCIHREDAPAVIYKDGSEEWYRFGKLHRVDGPARNIISENYQTWNFNGKLHREDGPALLKPNGSLSWFRHGVCHRDGGPAYISKNGTQRWYTNGIQYRKDGPTVIRSNGSIGWYNEKGQRHKEDGPAYEYANGKYGWFFHDREMPFEKWVIKMKLSIEQIVELKLIYG